MTHNSDDGYGVKTGYTYGYYRRLSPSWLRLVTSFRGVQFPEGEPLRYFELGFGQGVSLNVHAAANSGEYWGNDYNSEHVAFARKLADASGANVHLLHESLEDLAQRSDLPMFHVVVAHGIWSWISESTRSSILKFLDERLAPGGIFYVSYNSLPGSASGVSIQRFLHSVTKSLDSSLPESEKFNIARSYLRSLKDEPGGHFSQYPQASERLDKILQGDSSYYIHEYTVGSWQPCLFMDVARELGEIGLEFCGSSYLEVTESLQSGRAVSVTERLISETLADFSCDRKFRSDVFVRRALEAAEPMPGPGFGDQMIAQTALPAEFSLPPSIPDFADRTQKLRTALDENNKYVYSISEFDNIIGFFRKQDSIISHEIAYLLNSGLITPLKIVNEYNSIEKCKKLNEYLMRNPISRDRRHLRVSPVVGAGLYFPISKRLEAGGGAGIEELVSSLLAQQKQNDLSDLSPIEIFEYAGNYHSRTKLADFLMLDWH